MMVEDLQKAFDDVFSADAAPVFSPVIGERRTHGVNSAEIAFNGVLQML